MLRVATSSPAHEAQLSFTTGGRAGAAGVGAMTGAGAVAGAVTGASQARTARARPQAGAHDSVRPARTLLVGHALEGVEVEEPGIGAAGVTR